MVIYESMTPQCGRSVVQVMLVRVDIGVVTYESMTPQCGRSVVQVLLVRVDIGVVTYEAMTPQCGRSVVQVLVVRVGICDLYLWSYCVGLPTHLCHNVSILMFCFLFFYHFLSNLVNFWYRVILQRTNLKVNLLFFQSTEGYI